MGTLAKEKVETVWFARRIGLVIPVLVKDHVKRTGAMMLVYVRLVFMVGMENCVYRHVRHPVLSVIGRVVNVKFVFQENLARSVAKRVSQTAKILHVIKQQVFVWSVPLESLTRCVIKTVA